jgi:precorrin-2 dehydrogenase/sirohydrochlorin ferrochelatase
MIPLMLDPALPVLLVGRGVRIVQRLDLVEAAGARAITIFSDMPDDALVARAGARLLHGLPDAATIAAARLLFVADLAPDEAATLAAAARAARVPVNVEDIPALCDFHVPATVRRGDLLLTVSTGGRAPGAAARIRAELARQFGAEWAARLEAIAAERAALRRAGLPPPAVARAVAARIDAAGWLPGSHHETPGSTINAF